MAGRAIVFVAVLFMAHACGFNPNLDRRRDSGGDRDGPITAIDMAAVDRAADPSDSRSGIDVVGVDDGLRSTGYDSGGASDRFASIDGDSDVPAAGGGGAGGGVGPGAGGETGGRDGATDGPASVGGSGGVDAPLAAGGAGGWGTGGLGAGGHGEGGSGGGTVGSTGGAGGISSSGGVTGFGGGAVDAPVTGSGGSGGNPGTGGGPGTGGVSGTGGIAATGGRVGTGEHVDTGGSVGTGGVMGSGGAPGTGGGAGGGPRLTLKPDPSWTCGMPDGIPPPTDGTLVFSVSLTLGPIRNVGQTPFGERRQLDVTGGTIAGSRLQGSVMAGGIEYELRLSNGAIEVEEISVLVASDNTRILMRNCGVAPPGDTIVRVVPDIVVSPSSSAHAWLNTAKLVGTRVVANGRITLDIYDVSAVAVGGPSLQLTDPVGVPNTSWDCVSGGGTTGSAVFTANLTLGSSMSIGSRNVILITGGTTTGQVTGSIIAGGADYQQTEGSTILDQRFTVASADDELIIVRNCGSLAAPIPVFETRSDGPYAFLNEGAYLSSPPGMSSGGVRHTFYAQAP